jgi:hypothetical protein
MDLKSEKGKSLTKVEVYRELLKYFQEQTELSRRKTLDESAFSNPNWSEYQAFQLGFQKAFNKISALIPNPDQGE